MNSADSAGFGVECELPRRNPKLRGRTRIWRGEPSGKLYYDVFDF